MIIIGLTGRARTGKDTLANYLAINHGFTPLAFADPIRDALELGLGIESHHLREDKESVITNLSVATGEAWKDQQGQLQERTEWHRVVLFGRTAEIARDFLRKGSKLYLEGRLQTRKWQDKTGQDRYTTEIVAQEFQMLDRPDQDRRPEPEQPYRPGPAAAHHTDDDIPF